jgi:hypothetical protein
VFIRHTFGTGPLAACHNLAPQKNGDSGLAWLRDLLSRIGAQA